ncbi:hypothetical protein TRFO_39384 [Tritrichomonas foetus]|uniref:non-specific serine/threonine protein kinase n=1 Tax=Tritrichomonas foetus TaxID=1144522 RepID=A0A1J4J6Y8_9EUKA|nr:hypothetical protein TRFO_39384 [Tritrichomonas foetus]|eukprot:OHS94417.1 hypothetical protein TRFO_39384 [Tritrichomonas foetus]
MTIFSEKFSELTGMEKKVSTLYFISRLETPIDAIKASEILSKIFTSFCEPFSTDDDNFVFFDFGNNQGDINSVVSLLRTSKIKVSASNFSLVEAISSTNSIFNDFDTYFCNIPEYFTSYENFEQYVGLFGQHEPVHGEYGLYENNKYSGLFEKKYHYYQVTMRNSVGKYYLYSFSRSLIFPKGSSKKSFLVGNSPFDLPILRASDQNILQNCISFCEENNIKIKSRIRYKDPLNQKDNFMIIFNSSKDTQKVSQKCQDIYWFINEHTQKLLSLFIIIAPGKLNDSFRRKRNIQKYIFSEDGKTFRFFNPKPIIDIFRHKKLKETFQLVSGVFMKTIHVMYPNVSVKEMNTFLIQNCHFNDINDFYFLKNNKSHFPSSFYLFLDSRELNKLTKGIQTNYFKGSPIYIDSKNSSDFEFDETIILSRKIKENKSNILCFENNNDTSLLRMRNFGIVTFYFTFKEYIFIEFQDDVSKEAAVSELRPFPIPENLLFLSSKKKTKKNQIYNPVLSMKERPKSQQYHTNAYSIRVNDQVINFVPPTNAEIRPDSIFLQKGIIPSPKSEMVSKAESSPLNILDIENNKGALLEFDHSDKFEVLEELGRGGFGIVSKVTKDNRIYAMKTMFNDASSESSDFQREIKSLTDLKHQCIVQIIGYYLQNSTHPKIDSYFVMEFIPHSLNHYYEEQKNLDKLTPTERMIILIDIVQGMDYIHQKNIIHRDLKPHNILITDEKRAKIADFGLSRNLNLELSRSITKGVGTMDYMAPELLDEKSYDYSVDVYSAGIIFLQLILNRYVKISLKQKVEENFFTDDMIIKPNAKELIKKCMSVIPEQRPTFAEIKKQLPQNFDLIENVDIKKIKSHYYSFIDNK